jgi:hypothetical protein
MRTITYSGGSIIVTTTLRVKAHMLHSLTSYKDIPRPLMLIIFRSFTYKSMHSNLILKQ